MVQLRKTGAIPLCVGNTQRIRAVRLKEGDLEWLHALQRRPDVDRSL